MPAFQYSFSSACTLWLILIPLTAACTIVQRDHVLAGGIHTVDGLLTGFHEPRASHLAMLEALAPRSHLGLAYQQALERGYLWHEFGGLHLLMRGEYHRTAD
ncbi:MAG: S-adenosylmethionine:tRNA ribosyltransferase-isomerase [Chloroflexi bacterium]|nr:S-adenosylmethionine:tRNA ribosyltransferase-isomerase [Chloroflexota bacterium]